MQCYVDSVMICYFYFQWPGSGDYFHNLHHKHFDCNDGAQHVPIDLLFGTYAGCKYSTLAISLDWWVISHAFTYLIWLQFWIDLGKEDIGKIWRGNSESKKVGEEGNETGTHNASKTNHVEWNKKLC